MENHPIPQDITGFQFKLIGDMTVKQFAYVAVGAIVAWILFVLPITVYIKFPLAVISAAFGASLAFVPISGRPMDAMIGNFLKAVFSPTQYVYQKQGANWTEDLQNGSTKTTSQDQLQQFLNKLPKGKNKLDKKESVFFQSLNAQNQAQSNPVPASIPSHYYATLKGPDSDTTKSASERNKASKLDSTLEAENLLKSAAVLEKELAQAKQEEEKENQVDSAAFLETHQKVLELQKQVNDMLSQKQELEQRLIEMQKTMQQDNKPILSASVATNAPQESKLIRSIPKDMAKGIGLPAASEFPNVLTGIVKDPRGNPLANILVEVKDEEGNAVRAFKTNALGHFASATALNNGNYTIDFEDPRAQNRFDKVGFGASGQVILPIEIISVDMREDLRRSLFN